MEYRAARRFGGPLPYPTRIARAWRSFGAAFVVLAFAPPMVLLVSGSLRPPGVPPPQAPELLPAEVTTDSYATALEVGGLLRASVNSLIVARSQCRSAYWSPRWPASR